MERDRIPNFSRRLKVRKYKELYMFGRIRCGGANFHMESGVGGGGGGGRQCTPRRGETSDYSLSIFLISYS